jgi:hypothetical protein
MLEMPAEIYTPNTIDIEVTGRCEYNCPGCWGSKPDSYKKELTAKQWLRIFEKLDNIGLDYVYRVVITGGEALLRKDLPKIVDGLSEQDIEVSLSTTGLDRYGMLPDLVEKLTSIGIPIDGVMPENNSLWRSHNSITDGGLSVALDTLRLVQKINPDLVTSVRTLIHKGNVNSVTDIPDFLENSGIDISRLRWLLYELNNRIVSTKNETKLVSTGAIASSGISPEQYSSEIYQAGRKFKEVLIRTAGNIAYRNFIINPGGECRAVIASNSENELIEREFGNIYSDFKNTMEYLNDDIKTIGAFSMNAASTPDYFYLMQQKGVDI